jgi:N6-adenosine-specific RNA methylase IME4
VVVTVELVRYETACRALAAAASFDEVKDIKDKMIALEAYAKQARNPELESNAWAIRKRAEDKIGELTLQMEKARKVGPGVEVQLPTGGKSKKDVLASLGISTSAAQRYEQFHLLPPREKEARIAAGREAIRSGKSLADIYVLQDDKTRRRAQREAELGARQMALPKRRFGVIVADPEWQFEPWSRVTGMDRSAENHYPCSALSVIASRPVETIAADDSVLGLWATVPMLPQALIVMGAWGFDYKTHWAWAKDRIGPGYWNRNKHEIFLFGTRGTVPCPAPGEQWDSLLEAPRRGHSEKPELFLEMMECYFPSLPKIELNRRGPERPGWKAWGNEAEQPAARVRALA